MYIYEKNNSTIEIYREYHYQVVPESGHCLVVMICKLQLQQGKYTYAKRYRFFLKKLKCAILSHGFARTQKNSDLLSRCNEVMHQMQSKVDDIRYVNNKSCVCYIGIMAVTKSLTYIFSFLFKSQQETNV